MAGVNRNAQCGTSRGGCGKKERHPFFWPPEARWSFVCVDISSLLRMNEMGKNYIITRDFRNLMEFWGLSVDFPHKLRQKWSNWWWFVFVSLFCGSDSSAKKAPRRLQRGPGFCTRCMRCFCCFWTFVEGCVLGSLKNGDRRMGELFYGECGF